MRREDGGCTRVDGVKMKSLEKHQITVKNADVKMVKMNSVFSVGDPRTEEKKIH